MKKDDYSEKLCRNGKEIRKVQLELMKAGRTLKADDLSRANRRFATAGCPEGAASAEAGWTRSGRPQPSKALPCDQICDLRPGQPQGSEGASKETLLRSQRLIDETAYLTAKLRALEREIDGILTQEILIKVIKEGEKAEG